MNVNKIVFIRGSAVGAEKFERGDEWPWEDEQMAPANVGTINLEKIDFQKTTYVSDIIVNIGNTEIFTGGMALEVNDITVNGTSDFTAREEINISSEFHASTGSEVHIYPSTTFSDCGDYNNFQLRQYSNILAVSDTTDNAFTHEIELLFKKETVWEVDIVPNPNHGIFSVQIYNEKKDIFVHLTVRNLMGEPLKEIKTKENNITLDFSNFSKGVYFLEISTDNERITKKMILN